jgi:hypothetical protein
MDISAWGKAILIVVVFIILGGRIIASTGTQTISDNWPTYRCNPSVIPFAAQLAPDGLDITTEDNFSYCVQNTMSSFSSVLTQPLDYLTSQSGNVLDGIMGGMSGMMDYITSFSDLFGGHVCYYSYHKTWRCTGKNERNYGRTIEYTFNRQLYHFKYLEWNHRRNYKRYGKSSVIKFNCGTLKTNNILRYIYE